MESKGLQELVKKVFGNEKTKSEFMADPNKVMSRFSLTETERKAVLATHMKLGLVTGSVQLDEAVGPLGLWT